MAADPIIALERIRNMHKPCHMRGHYAAAGVCTGPNGHDTAGPAVCITCRKPHPCPTRREAEGALR